MTLAAYGYALLGFCLVHSVVNTSVHLLVFDGMPYAYGVREQLRAVPRERFPVVLLGVAATVPAIVAFTAGWGSRPLWAALIVVGIGMYRHLEIRTWKGDTVARLGKYVPAAAALFGWLVGWALSAGEPELVRERLGAEVACGVLAGAMMLSGLRKIEQGGWKWFGSTGLALMLAERLHFGAMPLRALRRLLLRRVGMVNLLGGMTVGLEVLAIAYAVPALRLPATLGLVVTVFAIMVLLGYLEFEWLLVYVALAMIAAGLPLVAGG